MYSNSITRKSFEAIVKNFKPPYSFEEEVNDINEFLQGGAAHFTQYFEISADIHPNSQTCMDILFLIERDNKTVLVVDLCGDIYINKKKSSEFINIVFYATDSKIVEILLGKTKDLQQVVKHENVPNKFTASFKEHIVQTEYDEYILKNKPENFLACIKEYINKNLNGNYSLKDRLNRAATLKYFNFDDQCKPPFSQYLSLDNIDRESNEAEYQNILSKINGNLRILVVDLSSGNIYTNNPQQAYNAYNEFINIVFYTTNEDLISELLMDSKLSKVVLKDPDKKVSVGPTSKNFLFHLQKYIEENTNRPYPLNISKIFSEEDVGNSDNEENDNVLHNNLMCKFTLDKPLKARDTTIYCKDGPIKGDVLLFNCQTIIYEKHKEFDIDEELNNKITDLIENKNASSIRFFHSKNLEYELGIIFKRVITRGVPGLVKKEDYRNFLKSQIYHFNENKFNSLPDDVTFDDLLNCLGEEESSTGGIFTKIMHNEIVNKVLCLNILKKYPYFNKKNFEELSDSVKFGDLLDSLNQPNDDALRDHYCTKQKKNTKDTIVCPSRDSNVLEDLGKHIIEQATVSEIGLKDDKKVKKIELEDSQANFVLEQPIDAKTKQPVPTTRLSLPKDFSILGWKINKLDLTYNTINQINQHIFTKLGISDIDFATMQLDRLFDLENTSLDTYIFYTSQELFDSILLDDGLYIILGEDKFFQVIDQEETQLKYAGDADNIRKLLRKKPVFLHEDLEPHFINYKSPKEKRLSIPEKISKEFHKEIKQWLDYINALMFNIEASRLNITVITALMTLELIKAGKLTYKEAFADGIFGGQFSGANLKTGAKNYRARANLIYRQGMEGMRTDRQYPQWLAANLKEVITMINWFKFIYLPTIEINPKESTRSEVIKEFRIGVKCLIQEYLQVVSEI